MKPYALALLMTIALGCGADIEGDTETTDNSMSTGNETTTGPGGETMTSSGDPLDPGAVMCPADWQLCHDSCVNTDCFGIACYGKCLSDLEPFDKCVTEARAFYYCTAYATIDPNTCKAQECGAQSTAFDNCRFRSKESIADTLGGCESTGGDTALFVEDPMGEACSDPGFFVSCEVDGVEGSAYCYSNVNSNTLMFGSCITDYRCDLGDSAYKGNCDYSCDLVDGRPEWVFYGCNDNDSDGF